MRHDKQVAINLRKTGQSYLQISQALEVPKSTLSYWLKNIKISKQAQEKISKRAYFKSYIEPSLAILEVTKSLYLDLSLNCFKIMLVDNKLLHLFVSI